jgi:Icc protein
MRTIRLALVADIHHGANHGTKLGETAMPLLGRFRDWCAGESPDLVLELGDRINDRDREGDARLTREVAAAFAGFPAPTIHLLGNHDRFALAREEAEAAFQKSFASHSRDLAGFHLVFWNADTAVHRERGFVAAAGDLDWLAADLAAADLPTVVFSHIPLDSGAMTGNLYFEEGLAAGLGGYANAADVRKVIEASGKVVLCVAGHTHWNALSVADGIPYLTVPSLTDAFMTWPKPAAAWGICELGDDIHVRIAGEAPIEYRLPLKAPAHHWVSKGKDYAPKPPPGDPALRRRYAEALGRAEPAGPADPPPGKRR